MSAEYKQERERLLALQKAAAAGDKKAKAEKIDAINKIRAIEREAAREGKILSAVVRGESVVVSSTPTESKRSRQEEYVRSFDELATIPMENGKVQSLREFHRKRFGL